MAASSPDLFQSRQAERLVRKCDVELHVEIPHLGALALAVRWYKRNMGRAMVDHRGPSRR